MPLIQNDMWEQLKNQKLDETMTLLQNPAMGEKQYLVLNADGANTKNPEVRRVPIPAPRRKTPQQRPHSPINSDSGALRAASSPSATFPISPSPRTSSSNSSRLRGSRLIARRSTSHATAKRSSKAARPSSR